MSSVLTETQFIKFTDDLTESDLISLIYDSEIFCSIQEASSKVIAINIISGDIALKLFDEIENDDIQTAIFCRINILDVLKEHFNEKHRVFLSNSYKKMLTWRSLYSQKHVSMDTINILTDIAEAWLKDIAYTEYKSELYMARKKIIEHW